MSQGKIIIRCDGGRTIGLGHVVRCLALADMLRDNFEILFALQETSQEVYSLILKDGFQIHVLPSTQNFDQDLSSFIQILQPENIVVLDGYEFRSAYQKRIKDIGYKLVSIDDLHAWHHYSDIVINHAGGVEEEEYDCEVYTQLLLGFDYALLRKEFLNYRSTKTPDNSLSNFFISMGAADENGNTMKFADALLHWQPADKIRLMVSSLNPQLDSIHSLQKQHPDKIELYTNIDAIDLIRIIEKTDLVICPASTIALETCSVGCLLMTGITAENQRSNLTGLIKSGMAIDLGDLNTLSEEALLIRLESIYLNPENSKILANQKSKMNGSSSSRISSRFKNLIQIGRGYQMSVRTARVSDLMLYYDWVNDTGVRANSFDSSAILLENHSNWFLNSLRSDSTVMFLFLMQNKPIGQVRFILEDDVALVNFSIDKLHRGLGLSSPIIHQAIEYLRSMCPQIQTIRAEVKPENIASVKAFEKNNFKLTDSEIGKLVFRLHFEN
ncbi:MAG: UDP-2,4-diacetamido-2,4,6-trideoxy-beta-L-altropyranose hydrolase [Flavobacteriales bacterium]